MARHHMTANGPVPFTEEEELLWDQQEAQALVEIEEQKAADVRRERNIRLTATDWTQVDDAPLTNIQKQTWATYRQALRDITSQPGFPASVEWPDKPE